MTPLSSSTSMRLSMSPTPSSFSSFPFLPSPPYSAQMFFFPQGTYLPFASLLTFAILVVVVVDVVVVVVLMIYLKQNYHSNN